MALAFDAVTTNTGNGTNPSFSHTITGSNPILIVALSLHASTPDPTTQSVTWNGGASNVDGNGTRGNIGCGLWVFYAPTTGTHTVAVQLDQTSDWVISAISFTGAAQAGAIRNSLEFPPVPGESGTSTDPSFGLASAVGDVVVDVLAADTTVTASVGAGQTQRWNTTKTTLRGAGSQEDGAAFVTMSWTLGSSQDWRLLAASIKPFTATATETTVVLIQDTL